MGKLTINGQPFSIAMLVYQRVEFLGSSNGPFFGGLLSQLAAGFFSFLRHGATPRRRRQQLRRPWPRSSAAGGVGKLDG